MVFVLHTHTLTHAAHRMVSYVSPFSTLLEKTHTAGSYQQKDGTPLKASGGAPSNLSLHTGQHTLPILCDSVCPHFDPTIFYFCIQSTLLYIFLIFLSLPIIRYLGYPSSSQSSYNLVQCTWLYWYYFSPLSFHRTILLSVISLLNEPNTFSAANVDASVMYRKWRDSRGKDKQYIELIKYVGYTQTV